MRYLPSLLACALLVSGCMVGPDYRVPEAPVADRYMAGPAPATAGMPALVPGAPMPDAWWTAFGSSALDGLVARALAGSPTLDEAQARVRQAQELRNARAGAAQYPRVDLTGGAVRQRVDPATFGFPEAPNPGPFNVFSLGATVTYDFDLFGGTRRELEGLAAQVDYRRYELEGARSTLAGSVVATVVQRATAQAQLEATEAILATQRRELVIREERFAAGGVARVDVQAQRALVAQTEASLPPLRAEVALGAHRLAVLLGEPPATADLPLVRLPELRLPGEVPLQVPAAIVRARPDIRASEALLRKASAEVGVATADLYPRLVLSAGFSTGQLALADLFGNGINLWNLGVNLAQPLFRGGELKARQRSAEAAYDQAVAAYRQTILVAFGNVADVLRTLEADAQAHAARVDHAREAREVWQITAERYRLGGVSELAVVDSERQWRSAEVARIGAEGARLADVAALYQAMGAGTLRAGETRADATPSR